MSQTQSHDTVQPSPESAGEKSWFDLGVAPFIKIILIGALIWWIFREEINSIVHQWLSNPSWSHGFLIPLFSLYFLNQSKNEIITQRDTFKPSWWVGLPVLLFFLALYPINIVMLKFMYGKPLISSEIGTGTSYININNETGIVVPPCDPTGLRQAMDYLWDNPIEAAVMVSFAASAPSAPPMNGLSE